MSHITIKLFFSSGKIDDSIFYFINPCRPGMLFNKVVEHLIQNTKEANKKMIVIENEMEAGDAIYKEIEDKLIFCGGTYYYKYGDIWTNKEADIKKKLFNFINHFPIFEVKWEGEELIYKQFATKASVAKNVCEIGAPKNSACAALIPSASVRTPLASTGTFPIPLSTVNKAKKIGA